MATYPKLVNKQFNSPIKLYSQQNVQEVLEKETQLLANGAVGIDFHQLAKPANLKNSAVLRMLEEEENRKRNGHPGFVNDVIRVKRMCHIKWPPENVNNNSQKCLNECGWSSSKICFKQPDTVYTNGAKQVIWPPPPDSEEYNNAIVEEAPVYSQGGPQYHNQQSSPVQQQPRNQVVSPNFQQQQNHPQQPLSPQQFSGPQQQQQRWAPVHSPVAASQSPQFNKPPQQQQQQQQQQHQQQQPTFQQPYRPPVVVPEPPPSTIILRPEPPISQAPAPIYTSQPATASLNGGNNMRGDQKWPPAPVKSQMEHENEMRKQLAKGPAFRPRKVNKDYSSFFAQHALNSTYPGYRAPPGTQYYAETSGVTNF